ncbi:hypothetical protein GCM10025867_48130 (plasmid) [Frondihabitans sucicola]|uniref:Helicase C-terminal domain-containing protein n=1 Tax=Frondihabitans sucicola TaxID=1268041 RepID=A0ABM8GVT2_9MICO|nr:hypothetical protein [Frondihabitans sucicola]BDZ52572.1 hypothetical protein GCM10025867_48130 [Frondihabitans sucicola]
MGVAHFDAWAATFVRYENRVEVTPDGSGFRMSRRPVAIQNFPEMRSIFAEIADLLPSDALDLVRPTAEVKNFTARSTEAQKRFVADLAERAELIRLGDPRRMGEAPDDFPDNMLLICGDGRKVALDPMLVDIHEASPKVELMADEIAREYHEGMTVEYGGTRGHLQLVFADFGTPHPDDSQTYGRVKAALVARGVPAERIRFIHEAKTDKARHAVFSACRDGSISILLGSTEKLGTGTNVQRRLKALHHLDTPGVRATWSSATGAASVPATSTPRSRSTGM